MSAINYLPTLSEDAWVTDSTAQVDYLFSHFFLSDYSQTQLYVGKVSSLPWIIQEGQGNMQRTTELLQQTLMKYFSRYFTRVTIEVTDSTPESAGSKAEITIYVNVTDREGKEIVLGKLIHLLNSKVSEIISISNG